MLKKIISIFLALTLFFLLSVNGVNAEAAVKITKKNDSVFVTSTTDLYTSYSTKSKKVARVSKSAVLNRIGVTNNGWTKVRYKNKDVYLPSSLVKQVTITKKSDNITINTTTNIYSSYYDGAKKLGSLKKGQSIARTGVTNNGWTKITYNKKTAYILSANVKAITITKKKDKVYATAALSVYSSYISSKKKIGSLKKNASVQRTGITSNGWTKITYNGKDGYVESKMVTVKKPEPTKKPKPTPKPTPTKKPSKIDPKHFSQYDSLLGNNVKSVDASSLTSYKGSMGYLNSVFETNYIWGEDCEKLAKQIILGDKPTSLNGAYKSFRMTGMGHPYPINDAIDSFLTSLDDYPEIKEVAIVRITYVTKLGNTWDKFVCVGR